MGPRDSMRPKSIFRSDYHKLPIEVTYIMDMSQRQRGQRSVSHGGISVNRRVNKNWSKEVQGQVLNAKSLESVRADFDPIRESD